MKNDTSDGGSTTTDLPLVVARKLALFMRCTENRVEDDYDGGLVLLQGIKGQTPDIAASVLDARLVLSAAHDDFMRQFPVTREEKQDRYFRITVEEVAFADVPRDPNAPAEIFNAAGEQIDANGQLIPGGKRLSIAAGFDKSTGDPR